MAIRPGKPGYPSRFVRTASVTVQAVRGHSCWADVEDEHGVCVHATREYPHGQRQNAYAAASTWAAANGYEVSP